MRLALLHFLDRWIGFDRIDPTRRREIARPCEGYLPVLGCACTAGVTEGFEYAFGPDNRQPFRPVFEVLHPLITGFRRRGRAERS